MDQPRGDRLNMDRPARDQPDHLHVSIHIEITTLEGFAAFCDIIRGSVIDEDKIRDLTLRLHKAKYHLDDAQKAAPPV